MKKKRTTKTDLPGLEQAGPGQRVEVHNREQARHVLLEIAQLKRHTQAIETDAYQSMFLICRSASRFLAPRQARMRALVTGLLAFQDGWCRQGRTRGDLHARQKGSGKKSMKTTPFHPLLGEAQS
ncbi:MAG: hypothetical protein H7838_10490 [Magnetococcus sp. DMHC-8]